MRMVGPWGSEWYRTRGLIIKQYVTVANKFCAGFLGIPICSLYAIDTISTYYAHGYINVSGVAEEYQYSVPVMHREDWNSMAQWIGTLVTEEPASYDQLISMFEMQHQTKIRWWKHPRR